jgi:glycosyltransferase involved in cell wall biosynthesis
VATAVGGIPEVVGDAAVLVPPGDEAALAAALTELLGDEQRQLQLADRGRARAETFTWTRSVDGLVALWRALT